MAKKKGIQIDFKELGLKYGDKIGLGVAGFLALLFVVWGFSAVASNPLTAQQISQQKTQAQSHMLRWPVKEEALEPATTQKDIKTVADIASLSESKKKEIPIGTLTTRNPFAWSPPREDVSRSNPDVYAVGKMIGRPMDMAYKLNDIRGDKVVIAMPKEGVKIEGKKSDQNRDRFKPGGGAAPGMPPPPPPPAPPPAGKGGKGGASAGFGAGTGAAVAEKRWTSKLLPLGEVKDEDILAVNIWPTRAAYVVGVYPYAKQVDELSRALKLDRTQLNSYFKELQIQRREVVLKGTRLPDGTTVAQDMVKVPDAANPGNLVLKPFAEVPMNPVRDEDAAAAGWTALDIKLQESMTRWSTEFWEEPDGVMKSLIALSGRLSRRLPKPLRGDYPALQSELQELKDLIEKIKKENTPIVAPRVDPRLQKDDSNQFEDSSAKPSATGGGAAGQGKGSGAGAAGFTPPSAGGGSGTAGFKPGGDDKKPTEAAVALTAVPDFCVVRFLDLTLADEVRPTGGRAFEYRVRVVMNNPNFGEKNVAVPEFAKVKELQGAWSPPVRVAFPEGSSIFADERQRASTSSTAMDPVDQLDKVPVQVHKWMGFFDPEAGAAKDAERMGEWWVDRVLAARGEYIGRVPTDKKQGQASLIVWLPYVPEDNDVARMGSEALEKFHTPSLMTRALLVDFEGGARSAGTRFKRLGVGRIENEDPPAELLFVEPDGRLVARTMTKDREDEVRKKRFDRWTAWFNTVKEKSSRGKEDAKTDKKKDDKGQGMNQDK